MSNLEIGYDEHEGKRRRLWWTKFFGLLFVAPVFSVVPAYFLGSFLVGFLAGLSGSNAQAANVVPVWAFLCYWPMLPVTYKGWLRIMKDDG